MKYIWKTFYTLLLSGIGAFFLAVLMPENVKMAIEIFKNLF